VILYSLFIHRIRRAHFSWDANLLAIFGLPLFSYLLLRSKLSYRRNAIAWKGRNYSGEQIGAEPLPAKANDGLSPAQRNNSKHRSDLIAKQSAATKKFLLGAEN
jgi:hypothetical protein